MRRVMALTLVVAGTAGCDAVLGLRRAERWNVGGAGTGGVGASSTTHATNTASSTGPGGAPGCSDGMKDGLETGTDCGGPVCMPCAAGQGCAQGTDCISGVCESTTCADNYAWSMSYGDVATSDVTVSGAATDGAANVLLTGVLSGTIDFGDGSLMSKGSTDIFLTKLGPSGGTLWSFRYGNGADSGNAVTTNAAGDIFVTGNYTNELSFGAGCDLFAGGKSSAYAVKLDPFGAPHWCKTFGVSGIVQGTAIAVDSGGNVLVAGVLGGVTGGSADFGGGVLTSHGQGDAFIAKYDPAGNYLWANRFGDAEHQTAGSVAVDAQNNVILAGSFQGSIDFGKGPLVSGGGFDVFVAKFDPSGTVTWSKSYGGMANQVEHGLAIDSSGNILLAGDLAGSVSFGGNTLTSAGKGDLFLAKLSPSGGHLWSKSFGDASDQSGARVAVGALRVIE